MHGGACSFYLLREEWSGGITSWECAWAEGWCASAGDGFLFAWAEESAAGARVATGWGRRQEWLRRACGWTSAPPRGWCCAHACAPATRRRGWRRG